MSTPRIEDFGPLTALAGIGSNPFLDAEFQTLRFDLTVRVLDPNRFRYEEDAPLRMPGREAILRHSDHNVLSRIG